MFSPLSLNPQSATPLYRQLYDEIRAAVLAGRLAPGTRLPSSRELAAGLGLARSTVVSAFEQLLAEGYLEGRIGAGTFVASALPEDLLGLRPPARGPSSPTPAAPAPRRLSARGQALSSTPVSASASDRAQPRPFQVGLPDIVGFPHAVWARIAARRYGSPPPGLMAYGDPAGYRPLREAVADHLAASRGVRCAPEQVVVVSGSQQGLDLAARVLLDPGDTAWIEDPGYMGARGALLAAGARLAPIPVDAEGLDVAAGARVAPQARLVYITPSHQFPLGVTMSLPRRLALLAWARAAGAWVIEDDYDSEYRYAGRPLAALQGLDGDGRVIYLGTFSKVLFPALRLGYLVAPPDLVAAFVAARALADRHSPGVEQAIVADFLAEGHFARHLRRMRSRYADRQAALVESARPLSGRLDVPPAEAGMHLVGWLPPGTDDAAVSRRAAALGIAAPPLSAYRIGPAGRSGLMLGYTSVGEEALREGVRRLAEAL